MMHLSRKSAPDCYRKYVGQGSTGLARGGAMGRGEEEVSKLLHMLTGFGGELENLHSWTHGLNVAASGRRIKLDRRGKIDLRNHRHVGRVEDRRVLQRLVLPLGHRKKDQPQVFAKIVAGGAYQVADVLDEQEIQPSRLPAAQGILNHLGFEVTDGAGGDLPDGRAAAGESLGVIVGGYVAD